MEGGSRGRITAQLLRHTESKFPQNLFRLVVADGRRQEGVEGETLHATHTISCRAGGGGPRTDGTGAGQTAAELCVRCQLILLSSPTLLRLGERFAVGTEPAFCWLNISLAGWQAPRPCHLIGQPQSPPDHRISRSCPVLESPAVHKISGVFVMNVSCC